MCTYAWHNFWTWCLYHPQVHMRFFSSLKPESKDKQFYLVQSADASESKEGALLTGSELCIDAFFKGSCELGRDLCFFPGSLTDDAFPHDSYLNWHASSLTVAILSLLPLRLNCSTRVLQRRILKEWRLRRWTSAFAVLGRFESFTYDTSHGHVIAISWLCHRYQHWQ